MELNQAAEEESDMANDTQVLIVMNPVAKPTPL